MKTSLKPSVNAPKPVHKFKAVKKRQSQSRSTSDSHEMKYEPTTDANKFLKDFQSDSDSEDEPDDHNDIPSEDPDDDDDLDDDEPFDPRKLINTGLESLSD